MKKEIKFIHCSDIHLGANPFNIEERFEDMGNALKQVFNFAIKEKVDFILIAGDFFHNKQLEPKTLEQAIDILDIVKKEDIPVFLTEGNHDMPNYSTTYGWLQFLSSKGYIYLLKPIKDHTQKYIRSWDGKIGSYIETDQAYIVGLGYPGSTAVKYIQKYVEEIKQIRHNDKPVIAMLHAGINRFLTESMAGIKENQIDELLNTVNYLALGHIHTRYEDIDKHYYNPGSLECVRISDNPFDRGFYLTKYNLETNELDVQFKNVKTRNSLRIEIDVKNLDKEDVEKQLAEKVKKQYNKEIKENEAIMLQLKIKGNAKINTFEINRKELESIIKETLPILHLEILNEIDYKDEDILIKDYKSREEIDNAVIKEKIIKAGFEDNKAEEVFQIIEKLKEYGESGAILLDSSKGEEIEQMLFNIVDGDVDENK